MVYISTLKLLICHPVFAWLALGKKTMFTVAYFVKFVYLNKIRLALPKNFIGTLSDVNIEKAHQ